MILNEPAAQKEAFNLAGLLTNVNPQNLIKPKVVNDYLLSIVMAKELAKISLNLSKPDIHARGMTTNDDILNQEIITSKKLIVGNKFPLLAGGMNWIATVVNRSTSTFATNTRALEDLLGIVTREGEFSESIKKSLPLCGNTVYGYKAPHKTGAGIGVLKILKATYDAPSVFFYVVGLTHPFFGRWCIIQRLCQSMVAQAGASSEAPVSFRAGYANPVWATTSEIGVSGGSVTCYLKEAATCWLLPLPKNRNLSGLSPQFAAIARQLPPKFIILLPSLNAMLAVLWCAITSAFLLVVSAWRWHMIKTYDVHMDPLERTSQIITLTEVINDILVSNSPSRDEKLKALLAILDLAVRDVHFLLEGGQMPCKTGATNE